MLIPRRAYIISFAMFFACLLAVLAIAEMDNYQKNMFKAQAEDEIRAGNINTAKAVLLASSKEVYTNYSFYKWALAVKEYCRLESLKCAISDDAVPKVTIEKENMRTTFPLPRRW